ncbi:MAG: amidohydrolase [Chitinophagales bacterium]
MEDLRIALIQSDLVWEDKAANFKQLAELIETTENPDLIILPEMFSTGFSMNAQKMAEPENGQGLQWMQERAKKTKAVVCGSLIIEDGGKYYNRLFWVKPNGDFEKYDKRHLFTYAGEEKTYSAGKEKLITELKGWKICPQVCYDLRFPAWNRNQEDYDLLFFIANWPARRTYAWRHLLIARAIENMAYTIGVNRIGEDKKGVYHSGNSIVLDPLGEILWEEADKQAVKTINLSKGKLIESRERFGFLRDRDEFEIN